MPDRLVVKTRRALMELTLPSGSVSTLHPSLICGGAYNFDIDLTPTEAGAHNFQIGGVYLNAYCDTNTLSGSFNVEPAP